MKILVTGGAGYIGSHTVIELLQANHEVVVADNLSNSGSLMIQRMRRLAGKPFDFFNIDVNSTDELLELFDLYCFDAVVHFAAFKSVEESIAKPLDYFENNVGGLLSVLRAMKVSNVRSLVYSSSATVYGLPVTLPLKESSPLSEALNPYGLSKVMGENILESICDSDPSWRITSLRYFNPVGAHDSGEIGEDPRHNPTNVMPIIAEVAAGTRRYMTVNGVDYPTADGSAVRDYIHVVDLALGHLAALEANSNLIAGHNVFNLGTGRGVSVLELVSSFEQNNDVAVPYKVGPRRLGDVPSCYADVSLAESKLGWKAQRDIAQMCKDTWKWIGKKHITREC